MVRNIFFAIALLAFLSIVSSDRKQAVLFAEYGSFDSKADFYNEEYLNGQSHHVETSGACKNLPRSWIGKALSVDTHGTCVKVCDEKDCLGTCKYAHPNNGEQQLSQIGMDRKVASVQGCFQGFKS